MPELPEVETVKLGLQKYLIGYTILDIEINVPKLFHGEKKNVIGAKITGTNRIGKGILIELDNGYIIAVHLKMTGQLIFRNTVTQNISLSSKVAGGVPSKYTHVIFKLQAQRSKSNTKKDIAYLYFNDVRKFGWIKVIKKDEVDNLPFFKEMGLDPLRDLTLDNLSEIVSASNLPIKILIMDQKKIGGIGNIYANEALFEAKIDPRRKAKSLSEEEINRLYKSILDVLNKGLKYNGASDRHFVNVLGQDGEFQNHFLIYGKERENCTNCSGSIKRITLGGRGTFYCPQCQR